MDLGLYNLKYPARKLIEGLLPQLADTDPDHISLAMLPVGLLIAAAYWVGAQGQSWLYLLGILLLFARMFLGTLDGLVATHYGKATTPSTCWRSRLRGRSGDCRGSSR